MGWVKNQDPDPGSGIIIPDHISESLETIFGLKILKFFDEEDPDSGVRNLIDPGSGIEKFGSGISIPDPQHCDRK
jgi:hypothetical protein